MEFLLINHPLDCPVCDKGGECPLQNQAMTNGQGETRFDGPKRTFPKPINLSAQVLLDRERCVSCARCTRFAEQIAGDPLIELLDRGSQQQVGIATDKPFNSYFSGNTIQICPVGALTSSMYRFRARPFDLVSTPTACEHCASGCAQRTDTRGSTITRRLAAVDPQVNEEWNCDKGRFAFRYVHEADRLSTPMIREDGALRPASWAEALEAAATGLRNTKGQTGVITGGRLSVEDALAYSAFARVVLDTNNVDFRARLSSEEEEAFLAAHVAGSGLGPTYADLEGAPAVLLVALEPEDESPIVLLRLRKAARESRTKVYCGCCGRFTWAAQGWRRPASHCSWRRSGCAGSAVDRNRRWRWPGTSPARVGHLGRRAGSGAAGDAERGVAARRGDWRPCRVGATTRGRARRCRSRTVAVAASRWSPGERRSGTG